jgi:alkaline phosphatase D
VVISRRGFLVGGASVALLAACGGGDDDSATHRSTTTKPNEDELVVRTPEVPLTKDPFALGVASGDPEQDSVVLWTRLLGAEGDHDVVWRVIEGGDLVVATGVATATEEDAHTLHVVADGLRADAEYTYSFTAGEFTSPVGRTRTTPDVETERMRFAFGSCQDWQDGLYTAHAHLAEEDVDLVVWLGDYIYESGPGQRAVRPHDTPEVVDLEGYRRRYALYKSDPALQAAHARAPWFVLWDDHEVDNNYAGDTPEVNAPKVDFTARRTAAYRAWWEHQPTRLPKPDGDDLRIYRALEWGGLATFVGLDGRQYRGDQPCGLASDVGAGCADRSDPALTMLGAEQEAWVEKQLVRSQSAWNVVANQTILSPSGIDLGATELFNLDQWDGYPAARDRMLDVLARASNPVVITGDIHASAIADLHHGGQVIGTELVGTSMTSTIPDALATFFESAAADAGAKMADARHHGYVVCEVTVDTLRADYRVVSTTLEPTSTIATSSSWQIAAGTPGVQPLA